MQLVFLEYNIIDSAEFIVENSGETNKKNARKKKKLKNKSKKKLKNNPDVFSGKGIIVSLSLLPKVNNKS